MRKFDFHIHDRQYHTHPTPYTMSHQRRSPSVYAVCVIGVVFITSVVHGYYHFATALLCGLVGMVILKTVGYDLTVSLIVPMSGTMISEMLMGVQYDLLAGFILCGLLFTMFVMVIVKMINAPPITVTITFTM